MSDNEITEWMNLITRGIWDAFGSSAPDIVNVVGLNAAQIVANRKPGFWVDRNARNARLQNALMGADNSKDNLIKTDTEITAEREIGLPYAWIVEKGGSTKVPSKFGIFYRLFKETQDPKYKALWLAIKLGRKTSLNHLPHPYIEPSYDSLTDEKLEQIVMPYIEKELKKVSNLEIIIGN